MRVLFYISCFFVLAYAQNYESLLIEKVLLQLFQKPVQLFLVDREKEYNFSKIRVVNSCKDADVVLGRSEPKRCGGKPFFALSYKGFIKSPDTIGAFYWRYGRPQLFLKKEGLKKFHLYVPHSLQRYLR